MKKITIFLLFFMFSTASFSQINELGVFAGGSNYIGDIGRTNFIYPNSYAVGIIYKWNMHPHYSLRANYTYSNIKGDDTQSDNSFRKVRGLSFSNDIHELSAGIEYHFFKYNLSKSGYTHTPYLFTELGMVNYATVSPVLDSGGNPIINNGVITTESNRTFNFTIPFGAGFKTILAQGVGIGFEVGFRYTFKDDIDGYPLLEYDSNRNVQINPNNNDWYVFSGITLVFAFGREGCYTGTF